MSFGDGPKRGIVDGLHRRNRIDGGDLRLSAPRLLEDCVARKHRYSSIEPSIHDFGGTEPGESTLDHVQAREDRQQVPPGAHEEAETESGEGHDAGKDSNKLLFGTGYATEETGRALRRLG